MGLVHLGHGVQWVLQFAPLSWPAIKIKNKVEMLYVRIVLPYVARRARLSEPVFSKSRGEHTNQNRAGFGSMSLGVCTNCTYCTYCTNCKCYTCCTCCTHSNLPFVDTTSQEIRPTEGLCCHPCYIIPGTVYCSPLLHRYHGEADSQRTRQGWRRLPLALRKPPPTAAYHTTFLTVQKNVQHVSALFSGFSLCFGRRRRAGGRSAARQLARACTAAFFGLCFAHTINSAGHPPQLRTA